MTDFNLELPEFEANSTENVEIQEVVLEEPKKKKDNNDFVTLTLITNLRGNYYIVKSGKKYYRLPEKELPFGTNKKEEFQIKKEVFKTLKGQ